MEQRRFATRDARSPVDLDLRYSVCQLKAPQHLVLHGTLLVYASALQVAHKRCDVPPTRRSSAVHPARVGQEDQLADYWAEAVSRPQIGLLERMIRIRAREAARKAYTGCKRELLTADRDQGSPGCRRGAEVTQRERCGHQTALGCWSRT